MQPLEATPQDVGSVGSPVKAQEAIVEITSEYAPTKSTSANLTSEGFLERAAAFGRQNMPGGELPTLTTSLSAPGIGRTSSVLTLHKTSSHPQALSLGDTWADPAGNARPTMPALPSPDSWATTVEHFGQPGQAEGSRDPYSTGDPALQVRCCCAGIYIRCKHVQHVPNIELQLVIETCCASP